MAKQWGVYILLCGDGSLYTGSTDDLAHRLETHRAGKGAKYTRGRGPLSLQYWQCCDNRSDALKREWEIKQLTRCEKLQLIEAYKKGMT